MSTGLSRDPSRGFDFTMEEGGVAVQRMQSRLSQASSRHTSRPPPSKSSVNPFGISRIRERAGSVFHPFSPKKRERRGTTATAKSAASGVGTEDVPPLPTRTGSGNVTTNANANANVFDDSSAPTSLFGSRRGTHATVHSDEARRGSGNGNGGDDPVPSGPPENTGSVAGHGEEERYGRGFGKGRLGEPPMEPRV